jgi:dienelactone hydrolase
MDDADALLVFADRDPAASPGAAAAIGYCMSGQYAINAAAAIPSGSPAPASIYGVQLVTDAPTARTWRPSARRPNSISPAPNTTATRRWRWSRPWTPR